MHLPNDSYFMFSNIKTSFAIIQLRKFFRNFARSKRITYLTIFKKEYYGIKQNLY